MLFVVLLALPTFLLEQSFSPIAADATVTGAPLPSGYDDWIIDQDTTAQDEVIVLNGSIVINGPYNLTLRNVTLKFNCSTSHGQYNLTVNSGGALYMENCTVTAYDNEYRWFLAAKAGSTLLLNATKISDAGCYETGSRSGVWINTNNAKVINCNFLRDCGLWLYKANDTLIKDNNITSSSTTSRITIEKANNTILESNSITHSAYSGIELWYSDQSTVSGNTVTDSGDDGIILVSSGHSIISGNTVTNSSWDGTWKAGIRLAGSGNSTVSGNIVTDSHYNGIELETSGNSIVIGNTVTNSSYVGIELSSSGNSTVSGNTVTNSSRYGIYLDRNTLGCLLWGNSLIANGYGNAYDGNGTNQWDNGTHGNWYDDYTGPDLNHDGIGDSPYSIGGGLVEDRYPLMNLVLPDTSPPTLDSPANVTYLVGTTGHTITWQSSDANPFWYQILRDGSVIANTTWDGAAITLEIDGLASGTYNYTIVVMDRLGYFTTDEVLVTVNPAEEETTEDDPDLIPGFELPLVGLTLAVGLLITRSRRRKRARS